MCLKNKMSLNEDQFGLLFSKYFSSLRYKLELLKFENIFQSYVKFVGARFYKRFFQFCWKPFEGYEYVIIE